MNHSTMRTKTRKPSTLFYGYRIKIKRGLAPSIILPTIFAPDVPEQWHTLRADESITMAYLYRRGKLVNQYSKTVYAER